MFAIRPILKLLLLAIPAAAGVLVLYNLLTLHHSIDLRAGLQRLFRRLPAILALALVCALLCTGYLKTGEPYSGSFKISYTYPKASKGLTPNGTPLNVNEVFSEEVLDSLLQRYPEWKLSADELKAALNINYVRQRSGMSADNLYVSTEYIVSYTATDRTQGLDKNELMRALSELDELDYLDIKRYLSNRASMVIKYMELCGEENSKFVSEVTGESFNSVKDKVRNFQSVSLERFESYVLKYGISQDRKQYISRLNFENRLEDVEYMKNLAAYSVRLAGIARYDGDITRSVLVPTRDGTGEYYQSRTKIGTDYFANEANKFLQFATNNQLTIETNNYHIDCLAAAGGGASHKQKTDEMVEALKTELMDISRQAVMTVEDYDAKTSNGYISFTFQSGRVPLRSYIKKSGLYCAALVCGIGAVLVTDHGALEKRKRRM